MSLRHRRRSIDAEAIAPWAALSLILLVWWAGATTLNWAKPDHQYPLMSFGSRDDRSIPKAKPVDTIAPEPAVRSRHTGPTIAGTSEISQSDVSMLRSRSLAIPVRGLHADDLVSTFYDARGSSRRHEAIDILAPRGTEVIAVEDGKVAKLFTSDAGGLTVYQFDPSETFVYYYAHLDAYAPALKEGATLRKGEVIGYVGTSGNAPKDTPHLHFSISKLGPDRQWWGGTALDPYVVWRDPS
jgi:peptidoglycan LD-endopeptidase LytH